MYNATNKGNNVLFKNVDIVLRRTQRSLPATASPALPVRATWARFLRKLSALEPAVIAVDAVFDQPGGVIDASTEDAIDATLLAEGVPEVTRGKLRDALAKLDGDRLLQSAIADAGNVVLGSIVTQSRGDRIVEAPPKWVARVGTEKRVVTQAEDAESARKSGSGDLAATQTETVCAKRDRAGLRTV